MYTMKLKTVCFGIWIFLMACNQENAKQDVGTKQEIATTAPATAEMIETGQSLFLQQCVSCHAVNMNLTGPALKGVEKRWNNKTKLFAFIRNSQAVIAKDNYARDLFLDHNKVQMPPFPNLKDEDLQAILMYIKNASISARH